MPEKVSSQNIADALAWNLALAETLFSKKADGVPPFSFVYGGRHSSTFIHDWKREFRVEVVSDTIEQRTVIFTDPDTHLEVKAVGRVYLDTPGVDWTVYFANKGSRDTPVIEQVKAVDHAVTTGTESRVVLHRLNGSPCQTDDWMPFDQTVGKGQRVEFAATHGRSSNVSPWFCADWGSGGVITAIGWSGQWCAAVEFQDGAFRVQAGQQDLRTVLQPGEELRSPRIMQMARQGGDHYDAYNLFRRTMMAHIMPRIDGKLVVPPIVHLSTAFHELNKTNEENVLSHLASLDGLGFEMFWLDAYWTGVKGFPGSMGDYGFPIERVESKERFPNGLSAIGEAVAKTGLGFVLWFEPERVVSGTFLAVEHPEWVISLQGNGGGLFNLGIPEARQYMTDYLNAVLKAYKVSCLRIDFNIDPLPYWQFMDAKETGRAGLTELRYIEGLYRMWDDILKANPGLFIDNCASGGRRIDLELMTRSIPLWRSDNTCDMGDKKQETIVLAALKNQVMSAGLNRYVPFSTCGQIGATPYLFRSGFNAGISFCDDVRVPGYPSELLKQAIAEGKRIRKYFAGNFYPLVESGIDPALWCMMQYHRPDEKDGMLLVFRRPASPYSVAEFPLREIDPDATYRVTVSHDYTPETPQLVKGRDLPHFKVTIPESPGSLLLEYAMT